jgi:predicted DNA-binding protein
MKSKKTTGKKMKIQSTAAIRASISFPPDIYKTLETIAKEKKVSLAWVVREATERYVGEQWPLFAGLKHND